ncbi:type VI secretion system ImpA family N-terminal domain-containing protein [Photobacterium damselae]|uniref:type VI secretion system ImpA family N-terminal domain-containing protein n=2 Tax=Photobacterium damselae TaxID=38293 RepID=UPI00165E1769|nr:type VI secretion system ImpA family N-terminal domain-containing protein [Photobacterium damselae]
MTQLYFSELQQYKLVAHEDELRDSDCYQKIRDVINKRNSPLSGSVDWQLVQQLCDELGRTDGFDFIATIYFTIAAIKNEGLAGLANGLELQVVAVDTFIRNSSFPAQKRVELYQWMLGRIGNELRALQPTQSQLRDLYRCERACQRLNEIFMEVQPEHIPDLEAIGYVVFEHIDRLENGLSLKESGQYENVYTQKDVTTKKTKHQIDGNGNQVSKTSSSVVVKPNYAQHAAQSPNKESTTHTSSRSYVSFALGLILGAGGIVTGVQLFPQWFQLLSTTHSQTVSANRSPLAQSVTMSLNSGHILTLEQGKALQTHFTAQQFSEDKSIIVPMYLKQANVLITQPAGGNLAEAFSLIDTIQRLYPNDESVEQAQNRYHQIETQYDELFATQYRRFNTARSRIANLQQAIKANNRANTLRLSQGINEYAIGLSPVYGRISYITEQLKQGDKNQAQIEWQNLNQELQAISFKVEQLHQDLLRSSQ